MASHQGINNEQFSAETETQKQLRNQMMGLLSQMNSGFLEKADFINQKNVEYQSENSELRDAVNLLREEGQKMAMALDSKTVEHEGLTTDMQLLKKKHYDELVNLEKQVSNAIRSDYEEKLQRLLNEHESEKRNLTSELSQFNVTLREKEASLKELNKRCNEQISITRKCEEDITGFKIQIRNIETDRDNSFLDLKNLHSEAMRQMEIDLLDKMKIQHEREMEISRKNHEVDLETKTNSFNLTLRSKASEISTLGYTNDQLTNKIEKLIQESEKLNDLSAKSKREVEELKSRISREGAKKKQEFEHLKVKAQEESDQRLTSLKRDLEKDHLTERTILDAKIKDLQRRLLAKENECNSMRVEVDRNETLLQEKEEEIDDLKSRFLELQKNSQEEIGDLTIMVETLQRSQMDTKYYESKFDAERESLTKQMALMEEDKDETLVRSQVFEREKKNLQVKVDQLFTECGDWKEKFRASVPQKEYNIIVNELRELKKEVRNEDDLSMRWNNEKKELEQDLRILREKNSNLDRERANLDSKVTNLKSQNDEVEKMADTYQKNSEENLNGKVAIERKFEELTHQYSMLQGEVQNVTQEKDDYLNRYNLKKKELMEYAQKYTSKVGELDKQDALYKSNIDCLTEQTNTLLTMRKTHFINDTESYSNF